jgi:molecular chaperone GrpE
MSARRQMWETLTAFLAQLETEIDAALDKDARLDTVLEELRGEIRRLGKAQFKANALAEDQRTQWEQAVSELQAAQERETRLVDEMAEGRAAARERELLEAFLPALDGLESAIASGQRYLAVRDQATSASHIAPAQAVLVSPADRAVLAGWLHGLQLVRERMLAILEAGGVTPIPTVGHRFDPYVHVAVGTTAEGEGAAGIIVAEERRGYRCPSGVLRYAEVVVYRPRPQE